MIREIAIFLITLSIIFTSLGGYTDMTGKDKLFGISKYHFWNDGLYLAELSIALILISHYS